MNTISITSPIKNVKLIWFYVFVGLSFSILVPFVTPYIAIATLSYLCLVTGLILRKNEKLHVVLMSAGIAVDLAIVLTLEFKRHAINTALSFTLSPLQQLHIATSTIATVLYFPVVGLGIIRVFNKRKNKFRDLHIFLGVSAFVFRSFGFILMFSLLWKK